MEDPDQLALWELPDDPFDPSDWFDYSDIHDYVYEGDDE